jgi:methionyl-tRNA synthetase
MDLWRDSGNSPPGHTAFSWAKGGQAPAAASSSPAKGAPAPEGKKGAGTPAKGNAKPAPQASAGGATPAQGSEEEALCKLDFRCGRILTCERHPDADSLYLLKVDVGDPEPRQVVSSLVKHYKAEELTDRGVMVYCNIKPGKMRGIESQAMVLAATANKHADDEKCELLSPPDGAKVGTRPACGSLQVGSLSENVSVKNISKVWGTVQPLLQTDESGQAMFKGTTLTLQDTAVKVPSLTGVEIS